MSASSRMTADLAGLQLWDHGNVATIMADCPFPVVTFEAGLQFY